RHELLRVGGPEAEEVEVTCEPVRLALPDEEQRRSLEDEPVGVLGLGEAEEEALAGVAAEDKVEGLAALAGEVEEPLADGGGGVDGALAGHGFTPWPRGTGG